jgi:hypothetical protein
VVLVAAGRCWSLLVAAGRCWSLLVAAGRCWSLLVAARITRVPFKSSKNEFKKHFKTLITLKKN